jgi:sterol desaturase/sphingolipid hydroxylase (fatty acid hydroxylase superfamily)
MFRSDWVERYFSRVRPWHVIALWVPVVVACWLAALRAGVLPGHAALWTLGGVLAWTLIEYLLHRFVFHFRPKGPVQQALAFLIHGIHHDYPHDADRLVMPPAASLLIGAILAAAVLAVLGLPSGYALYAGIVVGYLWYDLQHYAIHHFAPRTRWGKAMRRYHFLHHFRDGTSRFGVSTPLWDLVFGTHPLWKRELKQRSAQHHTSAPG